MRRIMRVGAAMFALLVAANVASAQGGGGGGGGGGGMGRQGGGRGQTGEMMSGRYLTDITLDDAQKTKLADAVKWYDAEAAKLPQMGRGGDGAPPPDSAAMATARAARTKLTADFQAKIKAFLTPDQATKFDANIAAAGRGGRRGGGE